MDFDSLLLAISVGVGATLILDLVYVVAHRFFDMQTTDWGLVGRWLGYMPSGKFVHQGMSLAEPIPFERTLGWSFHYFIGIGYGLALFFIWGRAWFGSPTVAEPLLLSIVLLLLPFCIMMPGMGMGIAASKAPNPVRVRLKSIFGHSVFGLGMFVSALVINALL